MTENFPPFFKLIPDKTENGSVSVSPKNASQGDRVTVTVKPDAGYELDSLKVLDKDGKELALTDKGDGRFTFIMPAGRVEVKATFTEEVKIDLSHRKRQKPFKAADMGRNEAAVRPCGRGTLQGVPSQPAPLFCHGLLPGLPGYRKTGGRTGA